MSRSHDPRTNDLEGQRAQFGRHVREALSRLYDLPYLQTHPLAPLARAQSGGGASAQGKALRENLLLAIEQLRPNPDVPPTSHGWRGYQILRLRYVEGLDVVTVCARLGIGKSEFQRDHRPALDAVVALLWGYWGQTRGDTTGGSESADHNSGASPVERHPRVARQVLPRMLTSFVGRNQDVPRVTALLAAHQLVVLNGPPGVGKTRLALEVAADLIAAFDDGVFFVPLAPLRDPSLVVTIMAQVLGILNPGTGPLVEHLKSRLAEQKLLLVLDNFEQVAAAAPLLTELLGACPGLRALVTSRASLHVRGEHEYAVPSLELPDPRDSASVADQAGAVRLFVDRAQAVQADFALDLHSTPIVAEICSRLDGLPLAIELVAARLRLFSPREILARLVGADPGASLELLVGGQSDLPSHQQTLSLAIDWSYALLDPEARTLLRRLSVFVGGWSLEAAEAVAGPGPAEGNVGQDAAPTQHQTPRVTDALDSLIRQSLVQRSDIAGQSRFSILETIRQYAAERLLASGEAEAIRDRHATYFRALAYRPEDEQLHSAAREWLDRLRGEQDNLRAALRWLQDSGHATEALGLGTNLGMVWMTLGPLSEGRERLEEILARSDAQPPTRQQLVASLWLAGLCRRQGDYGAASARFAEVVAHARALGDRRHLYWALQGLGNVEFQRRHPAEAQHLLEESLAIARELGDRWATGQSMEFLGYVALDRGDATLAHSFLEEALATFSGADGRHRRASILNGLGHLALELGSLGEARSLFEEAQDLARQFGDGTMRSLTLNGFACLAAARQQLRDAVRLAAAATVAREQLGAALPPAWEHRHERWLAPARLELEPEAVAAARTEGRTLSLEDAIAYALREGGG